MCMCVRVVVVGHYGIYMTVEPVLLYDRVVALHAVCCARNSFYSNTWCAGVCRLCTVDGRYIAHKEVRENCGKGTLGE